MIFGKIGRNIKREKLLQITFFQSQMLEFFLPRTSRYGATLFTSSVVKIYDDAATFFLFKQMTDLL
jgi:hypothetical protein